MKKTTYRTKKTTD